MVPTTPPPVTTLPLTDETDGDLDNKPSQAEGLFLPSCEGWAGEYQVSCKKPGLFPLHPLPTPSMHCMGMSQFQDQSWDTMSHVDPIEMICTHVNKTQNQISNLQALVSLPNFLL